MAHPTEGVWGLACDPLQPLAVQRLLAAKQRSSAKGLILVAANITSVLPYLDSSCEDGLKQAIASWPGPNTWILPAQPQCPWWLRGDHAGIAVRVTDHPVSAALCAEFGGALVSSSANISGHPAALHGWQARAQLGTWIDFVLAGELQNPGRPSTIRDATTGHSLRE